MGTCMRTDRAPPDRGDHSCRITIAIFSKPMDTPAVDNAHPIVRQDPRLGPTPQPLPPGGLTRPHFTCQVPELVVAPSDAPAAPPNNPPLASARRGRGQCCRSDDTATQGRHDDAASVWRGQRTAPASMM